MGGSRGVGPSVSQPICTALSDLNFDLSSSCDGGLRGRRVASRGRGGGRGMSVGVAGGVAGADHLDSSRFLAYLRVARPGVILALSRGPF